MSTKDNGKDRESDLSNVFPDLKTMQREADPSRRRANLEAALKTPPVVDAALTILREGLKPGEDPLYYEVPQREEAPDSGAPAPCTSDAAPSPWAEDAGAPVPRELLPSAGGAPAPAPAPGGVPRARRPRRQVRLLSAVIAVLVVLGPIFVMWLLLVRPQGTGESRQATSARSSADATAPPATASAAPTMQGTSPPSSAVVAPPAPPPSVEVGANPTQTAPAVAPPATSVKPKAKAPGSKRNPPKDGAKPEDDPETYK